MKYQRRHTAADNKIILPIKFPEPNKLLGVVGWLFVVFKKEISTV